MIGPNKALSLFYPIITPGKDCLRVAHSVHHVIKPLLYTTEKYFILHYYPSASPQKSQNLPLNNLVPHVDELPGFY